LRILIVTHYYPPELGAAQTRLHQLSVYLTRQGHELTVLTGFPNYPTGVIPETHRGRSIMREVIDGVRVVRTWVYAAENSGFFRRLLNHLSFAASAIIGSFLAGPADVVVVESPPLFVAASGPIIAMLKRARYVLNVADLWPEAPVAMGILSDRISISLAEFLEQSLLARSDGIVAVTPAIADFLADEKGIVRSKLAMHPNCIEAGEYGESVARAEMSEWFPDDDFIVMYAGTLSPTHAPETVVEAAQVLQPHKSIRFVFVGHGPDRRRIERMVCRLGLTNVTLVPPQPRSKIPGILQRADVCLNTGMRYAMVEGDFPAKTVEYLASGKPIISAGQAKSVMESSGAGIWVPPEDSQALADAVLLLYRSPQMREECGRNARDYAVRFFNRRDVLRGYEETLLRVCGL
jgi:hypothetical protein